MRRCLLVFLTVSGMNGFAQNVGINTTGATPNASAILDLNTGNSGTMGFLPERVVLTATNVAAPVTSPATGLLVYNTNTNGSSPTNVIPGYYYWNSSAWTYLITNAKASVSIPYLLKTSATSGHYYNPGHNNINDNFTTAPTSLGVNAAYEADNNYVITSNGNFSKVYGWLNVSSAGKTVTVYVYLYSPANNSTANIPGALIGSQTVTCTTAGANYSYEIAANTALTKGQFIMVWYVPNFGMDVYASGTIECLYIPQ